jgi:hypothetical protein
LEARKDEEEEIYALFYFFLTRLRVKTAKSQGKKRLRRSEKSKMAVNEKWFIYLVNKKSSECIAIGTQLGLLR